MSVKHLNLKELPKSFDPLKREYAKLFNRFLASRDKTKIETWAELFLVMVDLEEYMQNQIAKIENKMLECGLDKFPESTLFLNDFKKKIYYDNLLGTFEIGDMSSKDFKIWTKNMLNEKEDNNDNT